MKNKTIKSLKSSDDTQELKRGVKAVYYKENDLKALFETERYRFEQPHLWNELDLRFMRE